VDKGFGSRSEFETKQLAVTNARIELERNQMKARRILDGALPEDRQRAAFSREQAELSLKIKAIDVDDKSDDLDVKVHSAERAVANAKRRYERHKLELAQSTLLAPHDGIVVYRVLDFRGIGKISVGERVGPWVSPVELPNYERMKVRTQVPESFIRRIRARVNPTPNPSPQGGGGNVSPTPNPAPQGGEGNVAGSPARVVIKTIPDHVYHAEVTWIDGWARDRNSKLSDADIKAQGLSGVRVFDVEVDLQESDPQRLREGFRATVEFPTEVLNDVIAIPVAAVTSSAGSSFVQVGTSSGTEIRQVELGVHSQDRVVVTSGLAEGEQVLVPRPKQPENAPPPKKNDTPNRALHASLLFRAERTL
jgi:hypothetical protein